MLFCDIYQSQLSTLLLRTLRYPALHHKSDITLALSSLEFEQYEKKSRSFKNRKMWKQAVRDDV